MEKPRFADLHCHPNLKPFGHSFSLKRTNPKKDIWYTENVNFFRKWIKWSLGITRFSQADLSTMAKGNLRMAFVSLYPFEKGFFMNAGGKGPFSALVSDLITGIGYHRVRHIQQHVDYFQDLCEEYQFFLKSTKEQVIENTHYRWVPSSTGKEVIDIISRDNEIAVLFTIEGAHVFNSGLEKYGKAPDANEILANIQKVKEFPHPPVFITFGHNFNNDLCGHARSLDPLKGLVNQEENLGKGILPLGEMVIDSLLADRPIFLDLKHMSLNARQDYYQLLQTAYASRSVPIIVSHGAVTGLKMDGSKAPGANANLFNPAEINFFDEEIIHVAQTGGIFSIQFDSRRIGSKETLRKLKWRPFSPLAGTWSAQIIWNQIQHIAELLDSHQLFAWGTAAIGSDFDGTINPMSGILTMKDFPNMCESLIILANTYLKNPNRLTISANKQITPEELVNRFCFDNALEFISRHY